MKRLAFAILIAACTPDVDQYPVMPNTSPPTIAQAHQPPNTGGSPDSGTADAGISDGGRVGDGGIHEDAGVIKDDALAGQHGDAGSVPPFP